MLISLFRNQQRVISLCNNGLSVTRSWPFITHHLRCFLTKPRRKGAELFHGVQCQLGGLHGAWEQAPPPRLGPPASKAFQSQPHMSSHQQGFPNGQNLTLWMGKKQKCQEEPNLPSSTCFGISEEKLIIFLAMKGFFS